MRKHLLGLGAALMACLAVCGGAKAAVWEGVFISYTTNSLGSIVHTAPATSLIYAQPANCTAALTSYNALAAAEWPAFIAGGQGYAVGGCVPTTSQNQNPGSILQIITFGPQTPLLVITVPIDTLADCQANLTTTAGLQGLPAKLVPILTPPGTGATFGISGNVASYTTPYPAGGSSYVTVSTGCS